MKTIKYKDQPHFWFYEAPNGYWSTLKVSDGSFDGMDKSGALLLAIEKWKAISRYISARPKIDLDAQCKITCPLCVLFNKSDYFDIDTNCIGCPIYEETGQQYCEGTPYVPSYDLTPEDAEKEVKFLEALAKKLGYL